MRKQLEGPTAKTHVSKGSVYAVLTGDIVNSTGLAPEIEARLMEELLDTLQPYSFEFYRGDSFQVFMKDTHHSLLAALQCRILAISMGEEGQLSDVRISIGIGAVTEPVKKLGMARGEAFLLSGRAFDTLEKSDIRLAIVSGNEMANIGFQVMADYLNAICAGMTPKQAAVIGKLLRGDPQQKAAMELNKSKSTVSQLVSAGRWPEIERIIRQYENLINLLL